MLDRSPRHLLARLLTHERFLLVLIVTYLVVCMGVLIYLHYAAAHSVRETSAYFETLYERLALGGLVVLMSGALVAGHLLRRKQHATANGPQHRFSPREIQQDRIRLIWVIALSLTIFAVDLNVALGPSIGIAYVTVVLIAQFANSPAQVWFAAVLATLLTVLKLAISDRIPEFVWISLANRTLSIYALWIVAVLGQCALQLQIRAPDFLRLQLCARLLA